MNVCMENVVYCDQKGLQYRLDNYAVRFRQILYIQIPDSVSGCLAVVDKSITTPRFVTSRVAQTPSRQLRKNYAIRKIVVFGAAKILRQRVSWQ